MLSCVSMLDPNIDGDVIKTITNTFNKDKGISTCKNREGKNIKHEPRKTCKTKKTKVKIQDQIPSAKSTPIERKKVKLKCR